MQRSGRMGPEMKRWVGWWVGSLAFGSAPSAVLPCAVEPAKLRTPFLSDPLSLWFRLRIFFGGEGASTCRSGQGAGAVVAEEGVGREEVAGNTQVPSGDGERGRRTRARLRTGLVGWKLRSSEGEVGGSRMWSGEGCVRRKTLGAQQAGG